MLQQQHAATAAALALLKNLSSAMKEELDT